MIGQAFGERLGVGDHLGLILPEGGFQSLAKSLGLGGNDVHQRSTLGAWEHFAVDLFGDVFVVAQDQAAPWSTEGFVGCGRDHMSMRERGGMDPSCHQSSDVRDVSHQIGADLIGDLTEFGEVDQSWVGAEATDDQFGFAFQRPSPDVLHVKQFGVGVKDVIMNFKECPGEVGL